MAASTKDLQVHSFYGSCTIQVSETDTLSDVRATILNRYSNDVLPPNFSDFVMFVGDKVKPVWRFKEPAMKAWNVISNADWGFVTLEVYEVKKRSSSATDAGADVEHPAPKKSKAAEEEVDRSSQPLKGAGEYRDSEGHQMDDSVTGSMPADGKKVPTFAPAVAPARVFTHATYDKAMLQSATVLKELDKILHRPQNTLFCSEGHQKELSTEISDALKANIYPATIIGCLGATGVG